MKTDQPLIPVRCYVLDDLFDGIHFISVHEDLKPHRNSYCVPGGYFPLSGLPGTVLEGDAVFVSPKAFVRESLAPRCTNGVIGGFRVIRSAEFMKEGRLPVYGYDFHRHTSILIATVDYQEHERFNRG